MNIVISGLGMISAIGHDVATACASLRAGLSRPGELGVVVDDDDLMEDFPATGHPLIYITDGYEGLARYLRIGAPVLRDLVTYAGLDSTNEAFWQRTGLYLCRSSVWGDETGILDELLTAQLAERLLREVKLRIDPKRVHHEISGHAASLKAVHEAIQSIRAREVDRVLVIAVDSLVTEDAVRYLLEWGRLKMPERSVGMMPGEAGAAFLLEAEPVAQRRSARIEAQVAYIATDLEPQGLSSETPRYGHILSNLMIHAFQTCPEVDDLYLDLNGENHRAMDWGYAQVRVQGATKRLPQYVHIPAECLGDTGAASSALAVCAAVRSFRYLPTDRNDVMIGATSEHGEVAVAVLRRYERGS